MSDAERGDLEDEERFLKTLLDFYNTYIDDLSITNEEGEQDIDAILERIWEIKQLLRD